MRPVVSLGQTVEVAVGTVVADEVAVLFALEIVQPGEPKTKPANIPSDAAVLEAFARSLSYNPSPRTFSIHRFRPLPRLLRMLPEVSHPEAPNAVFGAAFLSEPARPPLYRAVGSSAESNRLLVAQAVAELDHAEVGGDAEQRFGVAQEQEAAGA